jgi:hypothetical protein
MDRQGVEGWLGSLGAGEEPDWDAEAAASVERYDVVMQEAERKRQKKRQKKRLRKAREEGVMDLSRLSHEQRNMVLRFLLARMPQDARHDLMTELPVAYVALFPGTAGPVLANVKEALMELGEGAAIEER